MKRTWIPYLILVMLLAFAIPLVTVATPTTAQPMASTLAVITTTQTSTSPPVCGSQFSNIAINVVKMKDKMMTVAVFQNQLALSEVTGVISNVVGVIGKQVQTFSLT